VDASGDISIVTGGNFNRIPINSVELVPIVPEPTSLVALIGLGATGLLLAVRRRRRKS
jgi:hypothetical protein